MCDLSFDGPDACSESWRRARKPHKCCACDEAIGAGQRYHFTSGIWDGRASSYKHCARCWTMLLMLGDVSEAPVDLLLDCGELWVDLYGEEEPAHLAFVTPAEAQLLVPAEEG